MLNHFLTEEVLSLDSDGARKPESSSELGASPHWSAQEFIFVEKQVQDCLSSCDS